MYKNIFLTGKTKVGKSTLLQNTLAKLEGQFTGFVTVPEMKGKFLSGFLMIPWEHKDRHYAPLYIAKHMPDDRWVAVTESFDISGTEILDNCLNKNPNLIVMDELGFFESNALAFQSKVHQCLDSSIPVLGVIKPIGTPFMNSIRGRKDVFILEVTEENRQEQQKILEDLLKEAIYLV